MDKIWEIKGKREKGKTIVESILNAKGIYEPEEITEFLSDKPQRTYDPYRIKNIHEAVNKIKEHIDQASKIIIFGDYDVDGISSTALLVEFMGNVTNNIDYYIPNRFSEGYGLNEDAILYIKEEMQGDLIITVDNGINSYKEVEYAKKLGLDIIVTDHHNIPEKLPQCIVINVKQQDDKYPFKELCGCGVAFKLVQALQRNLNLSRKYLDNILDLVTLATIADLVPLIDENRTIVKYGLKNINANKRLGLIKLREVLGLKDREINAGRIGYNIAPCFNAAGRIENAKLGVELLLEKDNGKAKKIAETLAHLNNERKRIQIIGENYCKKLVKDKYKDNDFLVLKVDDISEGVIGIIAGKMKDVFYKPTLVITRSEEGYLKGSGRSIRGINIYNEMKKVSDLFIGFGGHEMACGFSIQEDKLEELRKRLNNQIKSIKEEKPDIFVPKVDIVTEIKAQELSVDLIKDISKLEPYGMGNSKPLFIIKDIEVNNNWTRSCGSDNTHLKFSGKKGNTYLNGIGFSLAEKYKLLNTPLAVDVAFSADINEYNGKINPQMLIEDLREVY
jgi:single-stranded-DNA-specific exonuclease